MKKIVSDILIVFVQLIVGGLFLWLIFSDSKENAKVVIVENNSLNRMADATVELFKEDTTSSQVVDTSEVELISSEELEKLKRRKKLEKKPKKRKLLELLRKKRLEKMLLFSMLMDIFQSQGLDLK